MAAATQKRSPAGKRKSRPARRFFLAAVKVFLCLVMGAALGLLGRFGYQGVRHSPRFAVRTVAIRTGPRVKAEDVRKLSGIMEGKNIFSFSLVEAMHQIEFHPWVRRATITRKLPDRVEITVFERKPLALVALGSLYYADQEGEVFKRALPGEPLDFPVITGLSLDQVISDQPATARQLQKVEEVLDLASASKVLPLREISEVHLDPTYGVTLVTLSDGLRIRLGDEDFPERWRRLERVLAELAGDWGKVEIVDLNFKGQATVKLRSGYKVAMNY